ncbi:MAG: GNAT family N-acetyltransferase [Ilumatobacteraceae bacterium]
MIEFETERLRLRQWRTADRQPFAALNADPEVMEYFPKVLDRTESDTLADRIESHISKNGWGLWAAELRTAQEFIGYVGLSSPRPELPFPPGVEIGWRLSKRYWGHGFATEAAQIALRVGFESLELPEIVSFTSVSNLRSRAVMERLGMTESEEFDHPNISPGNSLRRHCLYRLTGQEWMRIVQA